MISKESVRPDGEDYGVSLSKLTGLKIKDIEGYISKEFGDPVFKMSKVVFEDGTSMWCEGEHDIAYLVERKVTPPNMDTETLEKLHE